MGYCFYLFSFLWYFIVYSTPAWAINGLQLPPVVVTLPVITFNSTKIVKHRWETDYISEGVPGSPY